MDCLNLNHLNKLSFILIHYLIHIKNNYNTPATFCRNSAQYLIEFIIKLQWIKVALFNPVLII